MAKRKQQNLEIEKQLKNRKRLFSVVAVAILAVVIAATAIGIWTVQDARWIMRYDGGRVASSDFSAVWLLHGENQAWARPAALDFLQEVTVIRDRAIYHGVDFTREERQDAELTATGWREQMQLENGWDIVHYISDARMAELFNTIPLMDRLMDIYEPTFPIDEEEFAEMFEAYVEVNLHNHMDIQILALMSLDYEDINEAYAQLGEVDFRDLMRQYMDWLAEDDELETDPLTGPMGLLPVFEQMALMPDDREFLLEMQPGEFSHIITTMNLDTGEIIYIIVHVVSRDDEVDLSDVEAELREDMMFEGRSTAFAARIETWIEEANFVINQRGYNRV